MRPWKSVSGVFGLKRSRKRRWPLLRETALLKSCFIFGLTRTVYMVDEVSISLSAIAGPAFKLVQERLP